MDKLRYGEVCEECGYRGTNLVVYHGKLVCHGCIVRVDMRGGAFCLTKPAIRHDYNEPDESDGGWQRPVRVEDY